MLSKKMEQILTTTNFAFEIKVDFVYSSLAASFYYHFTSTVSVINLQYEDCTKVHDLL